MNKENISISNPDSLSNNQVANLIATQSKEIAIASKETQTYQQTIKTQQEIIQSQSIQIKHLEQKIDYLLRSKFSSTSEKLSDEPSLFDDLAIDTQETPDEEEITIEYTRKKRGNKKPPPKHLPRVRVEHDLKDEEKICSCGCEMTRINELVTEQYDIVPARFQVIQNVRFTYACKSKSCTLLKPKPKTSPLPPSILPKTQITPSFLSHMIVSKFEDALPLHRQAKIYKNRFGAPFTTTTMSQWIIKTSHKLNPLIKIIQDKLNQSNYVQADETTLQVLNEANKKATSKSYIWLGANVRSDTPVVMMRYHASRSQEAARELLGGFKGQYLQTDGYPGYNPIIQDNPGVVHTGCMAHARRRFADILKSKKSTQVSLKHAKHILKDIAKLYRIERDIKDDPPDKRYQVRQEKAKPILKALKKYIDDHILTSEINDNTDLKEAFGYMSNQWEKLERYIQDGTLSIDNNKIENHVRPIAVGRKNWLFCTSTKGAKALAKMYTIIETAKANDMEPYKYLNYLLTQLPIYEAEGRDINELMPWSVKLE